MAERVIGTAFAAQDCGSRPAALKITSCLQGVGDMAQGDGGGESPVVVMSRSVEFITYQFGLVWYQAMSTSLSRCSLRQRGRWLEPDVVTVDALYSVAH